MAQTDPKKCIQKSKEMSNESRVSETYSDDSSGESSLKNKKSNKTNILVKTGWKDIDANDPVEIEPYTPMNVNY